MSFFYKQTIKNSFEHKILNKIKKQLEKLNINVKEQISIIPLKRMKKRQDY